MKTPKFDLTRLTHEATMELLFKWRAAEVHHAAIQLGLRHGDEVVAEREADDLLRRVRVYVDSRKPEGSCLRLTTKRKATK